MLRVLHYSVKTRLTIVEPCSLILNWDHYGNTVSKIGARPQEYLTPIECKEVNSLLQTVILK